MATKTKKIEDKYQNKRRLQIKQMIKKTNQFVEFFDALKILKQNIKLNI